ncbi:glycosyltransferase family 4 protein [Candidatus Parcubacteria bacterium]|nr:glycosyltransferase family 4 protein [Candidatus Parcubacteria bacterium]
MLIGIDCHQLEGERTGVGRVLKNLLSEWAKTKPFGANLYFRKAVSDDIQALSWGTPRILGGSTNMFRYFGIAREARRDRVDVLFSPMYLVSPFYRGRTVPMIQDISYEAHPEWLSLKTRWVFRSMASWSAERAAAIVVPSAFTKSEVMRFYRLPEKRIAVAPLAADPVFSQPLPAGEAERVKKDYNLNGRFLLTPGTIFTRRHIPEVLYAVEALANEFTDLQYVLVGRNETRPPFDAARRIAHLNASAGRPVVIWKQHVPDADLVALYRGAALTVYLSDYEGFGLPVIESLACGTPVLTNRSSALTEAGGEAAWYVGNPADAEQIAIAIRNVLTNERLRTLRVEVGRAHSANFRWEKTARIITDVFHRLTNTA